MAAPERDMEQRTEGLARVMEGNAITCEGVRDHLDEMNARPEMVTRLDECLQMCRDIAEELRR